jgi:hypothetical protein
MDFCQTEVSQENRLTLCGYFTTGKLKKAWDGIAQRNVYLMPFINYLRLQMFISNYVSIVESLWNRLQATGWKNKSVTFFRLPVKGTY